MARHIHEEYAFKKALTLQTEGTLDEHAVTKSYVDGRTQTATVSDITVEIDPASAVPVPPAGTVFINQDAVDAYLTANSGTAFKYLMDYLDTVPAIIAHGITLNCVAGIHRPRPAGIIVDLGRERAAEGEVRILGVPVAQYTTVHAGGTIRAHQELDEITGVADPYVDCDPATFPNDGSLRGRFAVFSNGFLSQIWDHDDERLWLCTKLNPLPVDDTTTVAVKEPATIFRNSINDTTGVSNRVIRLSLGILDFASNPIHEVSDLLIQDFSASIALSLFTSFYSFNRVILDKQFGPVGENGAGCRSWWGGYASFIQCSFLSTSEAVGADTGLSAQSNGTVLLNGCYVQGFDDGALQVWEKSWVVAYGSVFRGGGGSWDAVWAQWDGILSLLAYGTGVINTILDITIAPYGAISLHGSTITDLGGSFAAVRMRNVQGPQIRVLAGKNLDLKTASALLDGGDNTDVGIEVEGPGAIVILSSAVELTGTTGDVRFKSTGEIFTYAEITADSPIIDPLLNLVRRS